LKLGVGNECVDSIPKKRKARKRRKVLKITPKNKDGDKIKLFNGLGPQPRRFVHSFRFFFFS